MAIFAILNNNYVMNTIIAESKEIATAVTPVVFDVVEVTETTNAAGIGYEYKDGVFIAPTAPIETPVE